jgi:DNA-binding transcriptional LysR family regulator
MEEDLGILLFDRNNKKVALTRAGEYLYQEISLALKNLDNVLNHAKLLYDGIEGDLKFGYVGSAMQNIIPRLLMQFRAQHPNIRFSLKEMDNQKQIESLISQDIDIGFVRLEKVPKDLKLKAVYEDSFSVVLPKNHNINSTNFTNLIQLKDEHFILFEQSYSPAYYEKVMQIFDYCGFTPLVSHNSVHASTIYKLVENNFGVAIVPTSLQLGYDMNIKFIELKDIPQRTVLSAVWSTKNRNPLLGLILELIKS